MDVFRRNALLMLGSALAVAPVLSGRDGRRVVHLSDETEAIVQRLVAAGYHQTRDEVVNAALAAYQDAMDSNAAGFHGDQI
jgi:hypothetical protein